MSMLSDGLRLSKNMRDNTDVLKGWAKPIQLNEVEVEWHGFLKRNHEVSILTFATDVSRAPLGDFYLGQLETENAMGQGMKYEGWSMKWKLISQIINNSTFQPDHFLIVTDYDDVIFNGKVFADREKEAASILEQLTSFAPQALVLSAEPQCCVSALQHMSPPQKGKELTNLAKKHKKSKHKKDNLEKWVSDLQAAAPENRKDLLPFPNAGLVAGRVSAFQEHLKSLTLGPKEDDQAVFTDLYLRVPGSIVLDFDAKLFGNNPHPGARINLQNGTKDSCEFIWQNERQMYEYSLSHSFPLFLHTPGQRGLGDNAYTCVKKLGTQFTRLLKETTTA